MLPKNIPMNLSILLIGLFIIALFILPFYFVVRTSKNKEKHDAMIEKESNEAPTVKKKYAH
jgi:uncharacterized membrane protein (Fun14 family)